MTRPARQELIGCFSRVLCIGVIVLSVIWLAFSDYWPQALAHLMLAVAVLLRLG